MPEDAAVEFSVYGRNLRVSVVHGPGYLQFHKGVGNVHVVTVADYTFIHHQFRDRGVWADSIWAIAPGYTVDVQQEGDFYRVAYGIDPDIGELVAAEAVAHFPLEEP